MYKQSKPDTTWEYKANDKMKIWGNRWLEAAELLRTTADECKEMNKKNKDKELHDMLATVSKTPLEETKRRCTNAFGAAGAHSRG